MLPKMKTKPSKDVQDFTTLLYGAEKIGKSSFTSQFDRPLFLATEPGHKALSIHRVVITEWIDEPREVDDAVFSGFLNVCADLREDAESGNQQFRTIIIDTADNLVDMCSDYIRAKNGIEHESDLGYGKGWDKLKREFRRAINKLVSYNYGVIFISHSKIKDIETPTATRTVYQPSLNNSARDVIMPLVDNILFMHKVQVDDGIYRAIEVDDSPKWEAGNRLGMSGRVILPEGDVRGGYELFITKMKQAIQAKNDSANTAKEAS